MNKIKLSSDAKRQVFRLLVRVSICRFLARTAAENGWDTAAGYRADIRRYLAEARSLVMVDQAPVPLTISQCLNAPAVSIQAAIKDRREGRRYAVAQVSLPAAPWELHLLCLLVKNRDGAKSVPASGVPRLRASRSPVSRQWALALPYSRVMRKALGKAPGDPVLACCPGYRAADSVRSNSGAVRTGVAARLGGSRVSSA